MLNPHFDPHATSSLRTLSPPCMHFLLATRPSLSPRLLTTLHLSPIPSCPLISSRASLLPTMRSHACVCAAPPGQARKGSWRATRQTHPAAPGWWLPTMASFPSTCCRCVPPLIPVPLPPLHNAGHAACQRLAGHMWMSDQHKSMLLNRHTSFMLLFWHTLPPLPCPLHCTFRVRCTAH